MKDRIKFSDEMLAAVINGRKTQTRRIVKSPAKTMQENGCKVIDYRPLGDKWYRNYEFSMRDESGIWEDYTREQFLAKCPYGKIGTIINFADKDGNIIGKVEIANVGIERVCDISERDCVSEGIGSAFLRDYKKPQFMELWKSIYGVDGWNSNPWVWVIEFKLLKGSDNSHE